jgi:uncharacterized protein
MSRGRIQRVQDSVHGLMEYAGMETLVVDVLRTPEIQRLRRIRQLGLVHLVFPGAEHSRLVHSLGASHLAVRFGRQLRQIARERIIPLLAPDESVVRDFALGALCHDLGHGPLSHAWEREVIGENFDRNNWTQALGLTPSDPLIAHLKWHELVVQGLLNWEDGQLHLLLEEHEEGASARIRRLLSGRYDVNYLPRLLSSDIDVDRADFLRRDTHQTGVAYGRYDLDWLISTLSLGEEQMGVHRQLVVGFDNRKAIRVIEQFLIARQALYETVYHHKTVRCAEGMVGMLLKRLKENLRKGDKIDSAGLIQPIIKMVAGDVVSLPELLAVDDFSLFVLIENIAGSELKDDVVVDLARRIVARDLFKWVPVKSEKVREFLEKPHARERLYDAIKPFCPGDPEYYLIDDTAKFRMMSAVPSEKAFLVKEDGSAFPAHDHESLRQYEHVEHITKRIFTLKEAAETVTAVIEDAVR